MIFFPFIGHLKDVERLVTIDSHSNNISDVAFNMSLSILVTSGEDRTVKLWSLVNITSLMAKMSQAASKQLFML